VGTPPEGAPAVGAWLQGTVPSTAQSLLAPRLRGCRMTRCLATVSAIAHYTGLRANLHGWWQHLLMARAGIWPVPAFADGGPPFRQRWRELRRERPSHAGAAIESTPFRQHVPEERRTAPSTPQASYGPCCTACLWQARQPMQARIKALVCIWSRWVLPCRGALEPNLPQ
jgi:hypothetical protein